MARIRQASRIVEFASKCVRVAGLALAAPAFLLTSATGEGQSLRLHTPSAASPTSAPFVVAFDAQGQPLPPTQGAFPAGFSAQWQLPASPALYGLRLSPSLRYAFVGAAADAPVELSPDARDKLTAGGFLDASGNYIGGAPRSAVIAASQSREGRFLLVIDSSAKSSIALLEIGIEGGRPTVRSAVVKSGASLPADTFGALGAGITVAPDLVRGTAVFGDATATYALLYTPGATGSRFAALDTIPNPSGFHYLAASSAGTDGAFWVVGVNGSNFEVRYLDAKTKTWDAPAATVPKTSGDALIPAFDPYDTGRMVLVVSKVGSTPTYILTGLVKGANRGTVSPSAVNSGFDFSSSPALQPAVLAPVPGAARGYLIGRSTGESSERLYSIDLTTGAMASTSIVFGTARHQTLILERPDLAPQSLTIKADTAGAVSGGQTATFTVTRTDSAAAFVVRYTAQSADGSAVAGRDYDAGSGTVTMPAGSATAKISIPILAVAGCAPQRTFSVKLTNTDATLTPPSEVQQLIASSNNCTFGVLAPTASVTAGQAMTFTATRSGTYLEGAQALPWTAVPGNSATTAADFTPASSTVTLPSGAASATFNVNTTPTTLDCVPEKAVTVTVMPQGGASSSATGKIAPILTGCTVVARVTGPETPYLPGDEVVVTLSEVTAGRFDLSKATWTLTPLGNTAYEKLTPTGTQGSTLTLRYWSGTTADAEGSVRVVYSVPAIPGPSAPPAATGTLTLDRVAFYTDLVRMDGPAQYSIPAFARKRYSLLWGGSTRKDTWLNPKAGNTSVTKSVRWSYWRGATQQAVECERRVGEDCVFTLPAAGDVTRVMAQVSTGINLWATLAEIPVKGVPAPATTAFETVRYVPIALEFAGIAPAFFETELTLVNGSAGTVEAELTWGGITQKEIVGAGRQAVLNGLVESLRETNPSQEGAVGPLKITFRGLASEAGKRLVGVMARTTTPAGAPGVYRRTGRAGLAYRGVPREELLGGAAGQSKSAWLIGLRGTSNSFASSVDRSNLAVTKPDPSDPDAVVDVELYGNNGTLLTTLAAQTISGFTQWANLSAVAGGTEVGYARVVWKSGGAVTAYATPINNISGDGSWVFPVKQEDGTAERTDALLAPVLFELPDGGAGNFRFVADAALASTAGATNTVLDYFWNGGGQSGTTSLTRSVQGQAILGSSQTPGTKSQGVVEEIRKGTGSTIPVQTQGQLVIGMGLVRRQDNQTFVPGTLMAGARVDGPTAGDPDASKYGRFGIYLPAIPLRDLKGLSELRVLGLRQDLWVRSNLALINPGTEPVALKLELQVTKADGTAASVLPTAVCGSSQVQNGLVTLPARTFCQIGSVLNAADATSGYAILSRTGADAASSTKTFYAYGVVNDGPDNTVGTSDGAYLLAELASCSALGLQIIDPPGTVNGALPAATIGTAYPKYEGTAYPAGRTYSFTATGLPTTMSLEKANNKWFLQGTPTEARTYSLVITATDQAGCSVSKSYTLAVTECAATLNPVNATVGQDASAIPGSFNVTTGSACKWRAVPRDSWLTVTVGALQTGSQTVRYNWAASSASSRTGAIDIVLDGQTTPVASFTVTQIGGCKFLFDPPFVPFCQAGGQRSVTITPSDSSCTGTLGTDSSWITPPNIPISGQQVTVTYTVAPMSGGDLNTVREGTLFVQGQVGYQGIQQSSPQQLVASNDGPICAGNTLHLAASGGIAGASYAWEGPNGFTSNLQNPTIVGVTIAATGTYSVTQTINGCTSDPATTTVDASSGSSAPSAVGATRCGPGPVILTASGAGAGQDYKWYATSGTLLQTGGATFFTTISSTTTFYVSIYGTATGCESEQTSVTATVEPAPPAPIAIGATRCGPGSVFLTAAGAGPGQDYKWYDMGGTAIQIGGASFNPFVSTTTEYFVSIYSMATLCESEKTPVTATVTSPPCP